ncbi:TPA: hypothetical protein ACH3X1_002956 [Trebouxia sp. C0004]
MSLWCHLAGRQVGNNKQHKPAFHAWLAGLACDAAEAQEGPPPSASPEPGRVVLHLPSQLQQPGRHMQVSLTYTFRANEVEQQCVHAPSWPILLLLWQCFACKRPPGGAGLTQPAVNGLTAASAPASAELPRSGKWSEHQESPAM